MEERLILVQKVVGSSPTGSVMIIVNIDGGEDLSTIDPAITITHGAWLPAAEYVVRSGRLSAVPYGYELKDGEQWWGPYCNIINSLNC